MSRTLRWLIVVSGLCLASGLAVVAWHHLSKPAILTLAVGPAGLDDAALVAAWSRALAADGSPLRLSVIPTSGPVEALSRLTKGEAQLAVIRSDAAASERVRAVAILHKDPVVIGTPVVVGCHFPASITPASIVRSRHRHPGRALQARGPGAA